MKTDRVYKKPDICYRHKLEDKAWGNDYFTGICIKCLNDKVEVLWQMASEKE